MWKRQTIQNSEPFSLDSSFCLWQVPLLSWFLLFCARRAPSVAATWTSSFFVSSDIHKPRLAFFVKASSWSRHIRSSVCTCSLWIYSKRTEKQLIYVPKFTTWRKFTNCCVGPARSVAWLAEASQDPPSKTNSIHQKSTTNYPSNQATQSASSAMSDGSVGPHRSQVSGPSRISETFRKRVYPDLPWSLGPASFSSWKSIEVYDLFNLFDICGSCMPKFRSRSVASFFSTCQLKRGQLQLTATRCWNWKMVTIARNPSKPINSAGDLTSILQLPGHQVHWFTLPNSNATFWNRPVWTNQKLTR